LYFDCGSYRHFMFNALSLELLQTDEIHGKPKIYWNLFYNFNFKLSVNLRTTSLRMLIYQCEYTRELIEHVLESQGTWFDFHVSQNLYIDGSREDREVSCRAAHYLKEETRTVTQGIF
jgi:hypothetical protein